MKKKRDKTKKKKKKKKKGGSKVAASKTSSTITPKGNQSPTKQASSTKKNKVTYSTIPPGTPTGINVETTSPPVEEMKPIQETNNENEAEEPQEENENNGEGDAEKNDLQVE